MKDSYPNIEIVIQHRFYGLLFFSLLKSLEKGGMLLGKGKVREGKER